MLTARLTASGEATGGATFVGPAEMRAPIDDLQWAEPLLLDLVEHFILPEDPLIRDLGRMVRLGAQRSAGNPDHTRDVRRSE